MSEYTTVKILKDTHRKLRMIAAIRRVSMLSLMDQLADSEMEKFDFREELERVMATEEEGSE